jgi:hypothetical protein
LSLANHESAPVQLNNNDIIQLGVDYQGGAQGTFFVKRERRKKCVY